MFRNRMLGGVSFLPLFAPDGDAGGADPAEVAEHGDPEFGEAPAGAEAGEAAAAAEAEGAEGAENGQAAAAEAEAAAKPKTAEELAEELEAANKAVRGLTRRVTVLSAEKRDISQKLREKIQPVPAAAQAAPGAEGAEGEQPARADYATKAEFDAAVEDRAQRLAVQRVNQQAFNDKCNAVEDKGSKEFGDKWKAAKINLGVLDDEGRIPLDLLTTALETDDPAQVLFVLGNDIDKAAELMAMTPTKRAIAMDRLAQKKPAAERPRSQTPAPVDPITGRGGSANELPSDKDSDAEWHRKEGLREAANRKKRLGLA